MYKKHLEISHVSIEFPTPSGPFKALDGINLNIKEGEFVSLIGHSGCGKSTVLNIVAGLYQATTGGVILDGKETQKDLLEERLIAYLVPAAGGIEIDALRRYLKRRLPGYMVPAAFVQRADLPLNSNGKIDRLKLPVIDQQVTAPE